MPKAERGNTNGGGGGGRQKKKMGTHLRKISPENSKA